MNGFLPQDPETLRNAIDQAISSDAFQNAISKHLAGLIEPSIKSALDTIQPVVETVYRHDLLLRKMNTSVEDLLQRFDTNGEGRPPTSHDLMEDKAAPEVADVADRGIGAEHLENLLGEHHGRHAARLDELSNSLDARNSTIADLASGIADIKATLAPTTQTLISLKEVSEQSQTMASVMQAQLDQLKADLGLIIEAVGSNIGADIKTIHTAVTSQDSSAQGAKLDQISGDISQLQSMSVKMEALQAMSQDLASIKQNVEAAIVSNNEHFESLGSQVDTVVGSIKSHSSILSEIKNNDTSADVLAAVKDTHNMHASHSKSLDEIKGTCSSSGVLASLQNLQDLHTSHAASLDEIKSRDLTSASVPVATAGPIQVDGLDSISATLESLKANVEAQHTMVSEIHARDSSASIISAVQESHASHTQALEDLKSRESKDSSAEILAAIQDSQSTHAKSLEELKAAGSYKETLAAVKDLHELHDSHAKSLDEIKANNSSPEILAAIKGLHGLQESHASTLDEIRSRDLAPITTAAVAEAAPSSTVDLSETTAALQALNAELAAVAENVKAGLNANSDGFLDLGAKIEAVLAGVEGLKEGDKSADILAAVEASHDMHASHKSALSELKERSVTAAAPDVSNTPGSDAEANVSSLEPQLAGLAATLAAHGLTLASIHEASSKIDSVHVGVEELKGGNKSAEILAAVHKSHELHESHAASLDELKSTDKSADILAAVQKSYDLNDSHATALSELKEHSLAFGNTAARDVDDSSSTLEPHLTSIAATLASHTNTLASLHSASSEPTSVALDSVATAEQATTILSVLQSHTTLLTEALTEIKDGDMSDEILSSLHTLNETQTSILSEIRDADVSEEILTELHACNESHASHTVSFGSLERRLDSNGLRVANLAGLLDGVALNERGVKQIKKYVRSNINSADSDAPSSRTPSLSQSINIPEALPLSLSKESLPELPKAVVQDEHAPKPKTPQSPTSDTFAEGDWLKKGGGNPLLATTSLDTEKDFSLPEAADASDAPKEAKKVIELAVVEDERPISPMPGDDLDEPVTPAKLTDEPIPSKYSEEEDDEEPVTATKSPTAVAPVEEEVIEDEEDESAMSASTSAIASPLSPTFSTEGPSNKKGKKGKKEKVKKEKTKKDKNTPFVFDPEDE
jgi:hypothetical protein